jgi:hypothetical protein
LYLCTLPTHPDPNNAHCTAAPHTTLLPHAPHCFPAHRTASPAHHTAAAPTCCTASTPTHHAAAAPTRHTAAAAGGGPHPTAAPRTATGAAAPWPLLTRVLALFLVGEHVRDRAHQLEQPLCNWHLAQFDCRGCGGRVIAAVVVAVVGRVVAVVVDMLSRLSRPLLSQSLRPCYHGHHSRHCGHHCRGRRGIVVAVVVIVMSWSSRPSLSWSVIVSGRGHRRSFIVGR